MDASASRNAKDGERTIPSGGLLTALDATLDWDSIIFALVPDHIKVVVVDGAEDQFRRQLAVPPRGDSISASSVKSTDKTNPVLVSRGMASPGPGWVPTGRPGGLWSCAGWVEYGPSLG